MIAGRTLVPGRATGPVSALREPLSMWGGLDVETGQVIDRWHPDHGRKLSGTILLMESGRGSSSSASVIAEAIRRGTGPVAIVLSEPDAILTIGAMVAADLYAKACPIVTVARADYARIATARALDIDATTDRAVLTLTA